MAIRDFKTHTLVLREVSVLAVHDINSRTRRITLGGPDLAAFERDGSAHPAFEAPGFDDHVKLILASDGDIERALPRQLAHGIEWVPSENRITRDYTPHTILANDRTASEVEGGSFAVDFVVHGSGPAERWAMTAEVGTRVHFVGPKSSTRIPEDVEWTLLVGDETALPAIRRYLTERPAPGPVVAIITIADDSARQDLPLGEGDSVDWVTLNEDADGVELVERVRELQLPGGVGYAWCAGESRALIPLRRHLSRERDLERRYINATGYWFLGFDADGTPDRTVPAEDARDADVVDAHHPPQAYIWYAVRAALRAGVLDAIADRAPVTALAVSNGCDRELSFVIALLPALREADVAQGPDNALMIGPVGATLLADDHARAEFDGIHGRITLAMAGIDGMSPDTAWNVMFARSFAESATVDAAIAEHAVAETEDLFFVADGLAAHALWAVTESTRVAGPGAGGLVAGLHASGNRVRFGLLETEEMRQAIMDSIGPDVALLLDAVSADEGRVDLTVAALGLWMRSDDEARLWLEGMSAHSNRLLVIEHEVDPIDPGADAPDAEAYLEALVLTGALPRTGDDVSRLVSEAGWTMRDRWSIGWGLVATLAEAGDGPRGRDAA